MTAEKLITELNTCLSNAAQDRNEFRDGLAHLIKQFEAAKKNRVKMLKKEPCKAKRKFMKKELRRVERAFQKVM